MNINVRRDGAAVLITIEANEMQTTTLKLPADFAADVGAAMLGCTAPEKVKSLFELSPMMAALNPRVEVRKSDTGTVVIAFQPENLKPVLLQFDQAKASSLVNDLKGALDAKPRIARGSRKVRQ